MDDLKASSYQTYILFFSWTIGMISIMVRLFVKIELTPYILIIALFDIFLNLKKKNHNFNKFSYHIFTLIFIFYGWVVFSNAYSPSLSYKFDKTLFFIANIVFFIHPFYIKKIDFNLLIKLYTFIVLPLSAYFVYMNSIVWSVSSASTELFMSIRDSYLIFGMHLGILFLLLLYFKKNVLLKILTLSLLIATGARGPLLFLFIVIFLYLIAERKIKLLNPTNILRFIFLTFIIFIVYYLYASKIDPLLNSTFKRFGSLLGGDDKSALERVYRLRFGFNQPFEKLSTFLFGNGNGSFGILYEKIDQRSYPHNILVECFFEYGIIGLFLFLFLFISISRKISFKNNVFGLLFIFAFINAMKSSGITDLWILFSFMGGLTAMNASLSKQKALILNHKN